MLSHFHPPLDSQPTIPLKMQLAYLTSLITLFSAVTQALPQSSDQEMVKDAVKEGLTKIGFVLSTASPTATPQVVTVTTDVEQLSVMTPTPTAYINPTDLLTLSTTLGVSTTMTTTVSETNVATITPEPPAPVLSVCAPFFYTNSSTLYWFSNATELLDNPFFQWQKCQVANITSQAEAQQVASKICENVNIVDGQKHRADFPPYECPILSPDAVVKSPRGGCHGIAHFHTLCQLQL